MNFKVFTSLLAIGIFSNLADGIYSLIYYFSHGLKIWDLSTWANLPSYLDYVKSPLGGILTFLAIAPWLVLMAWIQFESIFSKEE